MHHEIAFLHTAEVHRNSFSALVEEIHPGMANAHIVDASLLQDARDNGLSDALRDRIVAALHQAASIHTRMVVCTCSTIGGVVESEDSHHSFRTMRIDRPMADRAVQVGARIAVIAALASTLEPTRELLADSARQNNKTPEIEMLAVPDAWPLFEAGDNTRYLQSIAQTLTRIADQHDVIVLAQASMAGAVEWAGEVKIPILSSPRLGVAQALASLGA